MGAIGDPSVPPGVLERGLLLKLRFEFDQYVNLRPSRPSTRARPRPLADVKPGDIDFVVVREGTEGLYTGAGGNSPHSEPSAEIATEESLNTRTAPSGSSATPSRRAKRRRVATSPWSTRPTC